MEKEKIDLKVMGVYCLYNKETKVYDSFITAFDDKDASEFYLENLSLIAKDLSEKGDKKNYDILIDRLTDSCVMRLATFNKELGVFNNEQVVLNDYFTEDNLVEYYKSRDDLIHKFNKEVK